MREIKFRAISECRGEGWVYGDLRHYARNSHTEKWTIYDPATGIETDIVEDTIGQFTGMVDYVGSKVFEGDILRLHIDGNEFVGSVEYNNYYGHFAFCQGSKKSTFAFIVPANIEIIGNIHEHLELLEARH